MFGILIFIVVLVVLILVHELGHFIVAKLSGMRVDEFGIGYPPRALVLGKIKETEYTLNWLPFGGFVRIYGEDGGKGEDAFSSKSKLLQAITLVAGIVMNLLLAYFALTTALVLGTQQVLTPAQLATSKDAVIVFSDVVPGSPADKAGFKRGDEILSATTTTATLGTNYTGNIPMALATLISQNTTESPMEFLVRRGGNLIHIHATPKKGVVQGNPNGVGLGVGITAIGTVKTPLLEAPLEGLRYTWEMTKETAIGLVKFFGQIFTFKADLSQVSGPIGIAKAVGQASDTGLGALLALTGLISINLALVNLIPIPALDGGRLLFVLIEAAIRKPLNPKIAERVNAVGFLLLILLMIVISAHDIFKLFV